MGGDPEGGRGTPRPPPMKLSEIDFFFRICHKPFLTSAFRPPCHALTLQEIAAHGHMARGVVLGRGGLRGSVHTFWTKMPIFGVISLDFSYT